MAGKVVEYLGRVKIDSIGRVQIPQEVRAALHLVGHAAMELSLENGRIILEPVPCCAFCGGTEGLIRCGTYLLCPNCLDKL